MRPSSGWRERLAALLVAPLLVVGLGLAAPAPARADQLDDALNQQKELAAQLAAQQKALDALIAQQQSLSSQLAATSAALEKNTSSLANITAEVTRLGKVVDKAQAELAKLQAAVDALDREISRLVKEQEQKARELNADRKSTRLNSSHSQQSRMPSSA